MTLQVTYTIHKVQPTNVPAGHEVTTIELARKGKTVAESVKCWTVHESVSAVASRNDGDLSQEQSTSILTDWFKTVREEMVREETRAAYASQKATFAIDLSPASCFAYWQANSTNNRLDGEQIKAWFAASDCAVAILEKVAALSQEQQTAILAGALRSLQSCAAPVPALTPKDAEKLLPYVQRDASNVAAILVRKLQAVIAKAANATGLDAL